LDAIHIPAAGKKEPITKRFDHCFSQEKQRKCNFRTFFPLLKRWNLHRFTCRCSKRPLLSIKTSVGESTLDVISKSMWTMFCTGEKE